jgi:hypothetical protein
MSKGIYRTVLTGMMVILVLMTGCTRIYTQIVPTTIIQQQVVTQYQGSNLTQTITKTTSVTLTQGVPVTMVQQQTVTQYQQIIITQTITRTNSVPTGTPTITLTNTQTPMPALNTATFDVGSSIYTLPVFLQVNQRLHISWSSQDGASIVFYVTTPSSQMYGVQNGKWMDATTSPVSSFAGAFSPADFRSGAGYFNLNITKDRYSTIARLQYWIEG